MIKYNDWGQHLRLGNWMFLYSGLLSIAKQSGHELQFPSHFMWKYMKNPPEITENKEFHRLFHTPFGEYSVEKKNTAIQELKNNQGVVFNTNLGSNLQSEKWFEEDFEYVKNLLILDEVEVKRVRDKYYYFFNKPTIGIGIRRGDFVNHRVFYQIPETWYKKALESNFNYNQYNIVIFSDDIEWCKKYYKNEDFLYAEANNTHTHEDGFKHYRKDPFEQFILASQMDNFIGGSSTFSWWNMWYVKNMNNGKVVHSGKNLSEKGEKEFGINNYYYPNNWVLYEI